MKTLCIVCFFFNATSVYPQDKDTTYKYWMTFSIGGWPNEQSVVLHSAYSFSYGNYYYKVSYFTKGRDLPFEFATALPNAYILRSVSVSAGQRFRSNWFEASGFFGPAYVYGRKGISSCIDKKVSSVGIEAETQFLFRIAKEVGMGFGFYYDLNFVKNFGGACVTLTLGNGK